MIMYILHSLKEQVKRPDKISLLSIHKHISRKRVLWHRFCELVGKAYHDIWLDIPMFHSEGCTRSEPSRHDLIGDEEHSIFVTDRPEKGKVLWWGDDPAIGPHYRFHNDGGNIAFFFDHVVYIACALNITLSVAKPEGTAVAIGIGGETYAVDGGSCGLRQDASGVTGKGKASWGSTMIGAIPGKDLVFRGFVLTYDF